MISGFFQGDLPFDQRGHLFPDKATVRVLRFDDEPPMLMELSYGCAWCDQRPLVDVTPDKVVLQTECPAPDGITTSIVLHVPSGKLVVADSLRPFYEVDDSALASYNSALGQAQVVTAMAEIGCAYGPVGNSCPGLYRTGPDAFVIANPGHDPDTYDNLPFDGELLAGITTDLWAYSIADFDDWCAHGGEPSASHCADSVVSVAPGSYRFTHHSGERAFDRDATGPIVYAHINRIR